MVSESLFDKGYWVKERAGHRQEVLQRLDDFLKKRDEISLVALVDSLWASEVLTSVESAVERRVFAKGFTAEDVAKKLELARSDPLKLLEEEVPGFGPASITEILFCIDSERFPIFNKRAVMGLKTLGYGDFEGVRFTAKVYQSFIKASDRMYRDFKVVKEIVEERVEVTIPKFDFVDGVLNLLYEGVLTVEGLKELKRQAVLKAKLDEITMNYALGSIQGAVKQYFYWLERGDSEDRAIEKAVNYATGMITSSGVLSDPKKRQAFIMALEAMSGLSKGIADLLKELP